MPITTEEAVGRRLLKPLARTKTELAQHLDIPYSRLNNIIKGKSAITPDTACGCRRW
jgi:plasmid maintenance system antidote protein VapI